LLVGDFFDAAQCLLPRAKLGGVILSVITSGNAFVTAEGLARHGVSQSLKPLAEQSLPLVQIL